MKRNAMILAIIATMVSASPAPVLAKSLEDAVLNAEKSFAGLLERALGRLELKAAASPRAQGEKRPPLPPRPTDAFAGLEKCAVVDAELPQRPSLDEAIAWLGPCLEGVSTRYGAAVQASAGMVGGPVPGPGIVLLVLGPIPRESQVMQDLQFAIRERRGLLLGHPAESRRMGTTHLLHRAL